MTGGTRGILKSIYAYRFYYLLGLPMIIYFLLFHYVPMYGVVLAFKDYSFRLGILRSPWVGLKHFRLLFESYKFYQLLANTLLISTYRLVFGFPVPIILAIMTNDLLNNRYKKFFQTISYLPHFISWVILSGIIIEILSPSRGIINAVISALGGEPIYFMTIPKYFRGIVTVATIWQSCGWGSIVYLAAISSIDVEQIEAAYVDGATRLQIIFAITLPSISSVIVVILLLTVGRILDAGFEQVFNLYNPMVYRTGDIIDTYVYRVGIIDMRYSFSTAVGLFKNAIGFTLLVLANLLVKRIDSDKSLW